MRPIAESRWRYLRLDLPATLVPVLAEALKWVLIGVVGLAGVSVVAGLLVEEGLVPGAELAASTDLVGRGALGSLLTLGPGILLAWALLASLRGPLVSRSLARSAERGADPADVPAGGQWRRAVGDSASVLRKLSMSLLFLFGAALVIFVLVALESRDETGPIVVSGTLGALAIAAGGFWLGRTGIPAWHARYLARIREHWTTPHRVIADGQELAEEDDFRAGEKVPGRTAHRLEQLCLSVLGGAAAIGIGAVQLVFVLAFPDRETWPGGRAGERAELSPVGEGAVDLLILVFVLCAVVVLLSLALAVVCEGVARSSIHRLLRKALADEDAARPRLALLRALMDDSLAPFLRVLAIITGAVVSFGWSLCFVAWAAESPDWAAYASAPESLRALGNWGPWIILAGVGLLALVAAAGTALEVRDRRLRDQIVRRWPVRPVRRKKMEEDQ